MEYEVDFSPDARTDLFDIYYYVAVNDSLERADKLRNRLFEIALSLSRYPFRGHKVAELKDAQRNILELTSAPYKVIYEVTNNNVTVLCVLDGRRNLQDLLKERLLR